MVNDTAVASQVKNIIHNLDKSSAKIDSITTDMNVVTQNLKNGKSAINFLATDQHFANNIDSLVTNMNDATKLLKQDLEAAKHSFLLRGYFKKQAKKQRQQNK